MIIKIEGTWIPDLQTHHNQFWSVVLQFQVINKLTFVCSRELNTEDVGKLNIYVWEKIDETCKVLIIKHLCSLSKKNFLRFQ